ncbi:MAG TPA: VWA domain-containing protein, partial [Vicinamibacterales bacterium]|nr:VWA domain-containing protein [Vicinamibacterales bacterium]
MLRRSASGLFALVLAGALVAPGSAGTGAPRQQPPPEGQAAQPPPDQPRPPIIRRGINYVSVDIIVTDRQGNPVTDLKPEDFEISEEGERQTIESFELVRVDQAVPTGAIRSTTDVEREVARPDVRIFAIFLDDYHVRRGADLRVREPLARFLQQHLAPTDLVGVMYPLTPIGDFQLTRDHEAVVSAVTQFLGRKYDYEPRNAFEERYMYYPAAVVERIRNQVTLSALKALVTHLGGLREGRKAVILVSEGFTNTLPPQLSDPIAAAPGIGNPNRRRNTQILEEDPRYQAQQFFENVDLQADLREVYAAANRANTSIYALDPRGLGGFEFDIGDGVSLTMDRRIGDNTRDTLMVLANETDGRAIVNRNDLDAGLRQVVRDLSSYYLVGYSSTRSPTDGKFHRIEVKVRRPGLQVRARKGYWALTAEAAARATAPPAPGPPPEVGKALAAIATPRGRMVRTWVGTTRAEEGRTRVTFVWEAVAPAVRAADAEPPARVTLTAVAASGDPVFRGPVPAASPPGASPSSA